MAAMISGCRDGGSIGGDEVFDSDDERRFSGDNDKNGKIVALSVVVVSMSKMIVVVRQQSMVDRQSTSFDEILLMVVG